MAQFLVVVLNQSADRAGGPLQPAIAPAVGAAAIVQLLSETAVAALAQVVADWQRAIGGAMAPAGQVAVAGVDQLVPALLSILPTAAAPQPAAAPQIASPVIASRASDVDVRESETARAQPAPSTHRMPGWLSAQATRQAALAGRMARRMPAGRSRNRTVNRPARRPSAPKPVARRPVVWMAAR